jgi:hypothetical protein
MDHCQPFFRFFPCVSHTLTLPPSFSPYQFLPQMYETQFISSVDGLITIATEELCPGFTVDALKIHPVVFAVGTQLPPLAWSKDLTDAGEATEEKNPGEVAEFLDSALERLGEKSVLFIRFGVRTRLAFGRSLSPTLILLLEYYLDQFWLHLATRYHHQS